MPAFIDALLSHFNLSEQSFADFQEWIMANAMNGSVFLQLAIAAFIALGAWIFAKKTAHNTSIQNFCARHTVLARLHTSTQELFFLFYVIASLWIAIVFLQGFEQPFAILKTLASLATVWIIIRFVSTTIKSNFWAKTIAITLWVVAALNILGWLTPTMTVLAQASVTIGDFKLSALMVLKGIMIFAILLWVVNFTSGLLGKFFNNVDDITPSQKVLFTKFSNIALFAMAIMVGLNMIGLDLTVLTVFGGALGFGIGFGLQKVFSNLISGFILLLDKSIKPGDVIVVDDTYGWVNSLGARCISVITRDGKEHLIPNEDLITQKVENWSYSNKQVRLHIPVGVSYNSDLILVREILLKSAENNPRVLDVPKAVCLIKGFGDSSVDHELRIWIEDPQDGLSNIKSQIYYRIWELFKEHNVEIPFPQRDVHIKSNPQG